MQRVAIITVGYVKSLLEKHKAFKLTQMTSMSVQKKHVL